MRLVERHQLVVVDRFTCEFRDHPGGGGKTNSWADAMEYIYETAQPVHGRPATKAKRDEMIASLRLVPVGSVVYKPAVLF